MTAPRRWRDIFQDWFPNWMSIGDTVQGRVAYRVLWVLHATIDKLTEGMTQAFMSALPGYGDPSALPLIGQSRGLLRGKSDSNADFAARLVAWRQKAQLLGSRVGLATYLHEYLPGRPRVDVVNRAGSWTRCDTDGSITQYRNVPWTWDTFTHPQRTDDYSDIWIIIASPYPQRPGTIGGLAALTLAQRSATALGMTCPQSDVQDVLSILRYVKSAGSRIREVIWNTDPTAFDPTNHLTQPQGFAANWGTGDSVQEPNTLGRPISYQRYWEPN